MQNQAERSLLLIPVHNYLEGVRRLKAFADSQLDSLVGDWHAVLVDNCSGAREAAELKSMAGGRWSYIHQPVPKNLKANFELGMQEGRKRIDPTMVMIWETDAVPNKTTLQAMLEVYLEERGSDKLASVSPMYKWQGRWCYPTHRHWHTDPVHKKHAKWGEVTKVHAVPFVFSLWTPESLININGNGTENFCPFLQLCRDWGVKLSKEGKLHLRLKEHSVDHWGGGKMTRK
jgi:hypothetical protein